MYSLAVHKNEVEWNTLKYKLYSLYVLLYCIVISSLHPSSLAVLLQVNTTDAEAS